MEQLLVAFDHSVISLKMYLREEKNVNATTLHTGKIIVKMTVEAEEHEVSKFENVLHSRLCHRKHPIRDLQTVNGWKLIFVKLVDNLTGLHQLTIFLILCAHCSGDPLKRNVYSGRRGPAHFNALWYR